MNEMIPANYILQAAGDSTAWNRQLIIQNGCRYRTARSGAPEIYRRRDRLAYLSTSTSSIS